MTVKIDDEIVERACAVFYANDWLYEGWDAEHIGGRCDKCGAVCSGEGDGGASVRAEVRRMLQEIFRVQGESE